MNSRRCSCVFMRAALTSSFAEHDVRNTTGCGDRLTLADLFGSMIAMRTSPNHMKLSFRSYARVPRSSNRLRIGSSR